MHRETPCHFRNESLVSLNVSKIKNVLNQSDGWNTLLFKYNIGPSLGPWASKFYECKFSISKNYKKYNQKTFHMIPSMVIQLIFSFNYLRRLRSSKVRIIQYINIMYYWNNTGKTRNNYFYALDHGSFFKWSNFKVFCF